MRNMLPSLYKKTKTGKINKWVCYSIQDEVHTSSGYVDGAVQTYSFKCEAKNKGRSNETTPEQQAVLEAKAKWEKQKKKGYVEDESGETSLQLPMKISTYKEGCMKDTMCYISPKLDGVNAEYRLEGRKLSLISRGGEEYLIPEQQVDEVVFLMEQANITSLAGEMYKHGEWLQDITGAMKKKRPLTNKLEFHIFDIPCLDIPYIDRVAILRNMAILTGCSTQYVKVVEESYCESSLIKEMHKKYTDMGYEGIVIRAEQSLYQYNIRANDVWKLKTPKDSEFLIVSHTKDKNGHPVFTCITEEGNLFKCKPKGTDEQRKEILENALHWHGKWAKVEYESLSKTGIPLKPVMLGVREKQNNVFV